MSELTQSVLESLCRVSGVQLRVTTLIVRPEEAAWRVFESWRVQMKLPKGTVVGNEFVLVL
jgi:hypothetical protein